MVDKRTADVLRAIEEEIASLHTKADSIHTMVEALLDDRAVPQFVEHENSAEIDIGGFRAQITRDFWKTHGGKVKWALLAAIGWAAGWFSKLLHGTMQR